MESNKWGWAGAEQEERIKSNQIKLKDRVDRVSKQDQSPGIRWELSIQYLVLEAACLLRFASPLPPPIELLEVILVVYI